MSAEQSLKQLAKDKTLGHGYIFHGSDTQGMFKVAKKLANYLEKGKPRRLEGRGADLAARPDRIVGAQASAWELPETVLSDALFVDGAKQDLGVDVAREFTSFLYKFPAASQYRTLVINGAIDLTVQAQNALLKIAEEPPKHALIILVVNELTVLLPLLLSRFQKVFFAGGAETKEVLTPAQEEAKDLVKKFLAANPKAKSDLIKEMVTNEREIDEKSEKVVDHFTRFLIEELSKKPEANWRALKHLLYRQQVMADYSTNKRLQLESVISFLP